MSLPVLLGIGAYGLAVLFALALCAAAGRADRAIERISRERDRA